MIRDVRTASSVGRNARLELLFEKRRGRTCLAHAYCEPPFRVGRCLTLDDAAYVIIVCSGPGVFGGDLLQQSIHVSRGARVVLTSQAALQVHPGIRKSSATVDQRYVIEEEAELHAHWDPVIPFAAAHLTQRFDVRLAKSARLYWNDAIMAGRVSRGESWQFDELGHELRLSIADRLAFLERYELRPGSEDSMRRWIAGHAKYIATMLVRHPNANTESAEALHREVAAIPAASAAVDLVEPELIVGRMTAVGGVPFAAVRDRSRCLVLDRVFESPQLAGRKAV